MMMMFQQRWRLLLLAAFFLLFFVSTVAEVVDSMSDCDQFLLNKVSPQVPGILKGGKILNQNRYKPICQTFKDQRRYLTLYDTENKIPVFSACKISKEQVPGRPKTPWKIEPQLEDKNTNNMRDYSLNHQASNDDYKNSTVYNRGHLFPSSHAFDFDEKRSTFTLTNIVPQEVSFNAGSWHKMEECVKCIMQKYCINNNGVIEGFVVTGAQPSNNTHGKNVTIPSLLWTAFCCYNKNKGKWLASAHWGDNIADESKSKSLPTKTLAELHQKLSTANLKFEVFPGTQCPLHSTVDEFYPELPKNCECPSKASTTTSAPHLPTSSAPSSTSYLLYTCMCLYIVLLIPH